MTIAKVNQDKEINKFQNEMWSILNVGQKIMVITEVNKYGQRMTYCGKIVEKNEEFHLIKIEEYDKVLNILETNSVKLSEIWYFHFV